MGIFSSIKKSFKKIVKKVGRGIKKVASGIGKVLGKIAKPFAKMGVLGQIALGFIMPWAVGGIFKGLGYLASSGFGAFAGNMAGSANLFTSAVGKLAQGIHMGASGINKAYSFISDGITAGLNKVSELGSKLKTGITNKYDAAKEWITGTPTYDDALGKELFTSGVDDFANVTQTITDDAGVSTYFGKSKGLSDSSKIAEAVSKNTAEYTGNALGRTGDKLISGGTKAFRGAGTAVGEFMKGEGDYKETGQVEYADEGPVVSYLNPTEKTTIEDINFQVKNSGGTFLGPIDSMALMEQYKFV